MKRLSPEYHNPLCALGSHRGTWSINGCLGSHIGTTSNADTVWPSANAAIFLPIRIIESTLIVNIAVNNGAAVAGNTDVGIYSVDGVRLVSSGSTAQAGINTLQIFNITDTMIGPGMYYIAVAHDEATTGQITRVAFASANIPKIIGVAEVASAFPLPATVTLATSTLNYIPGVVLGIGGAGVI